MITNSTIDAVPCEMTTRAWDNSSIAPARRLTWFQKLARQKLLGWLKDLEGGLIHYADPVMASSAYGDLPTDGVQADWTVRDPQFFRRLAIDGSLGMAESYLQNEWQTTDLTKLLRVMCRNLHRMESADSGLATISKVVRQLMTRLDANTQSGSKRNIAAHYDLSNDFFALFLDPTMMYSSAYFEHPEATLHEASLAKIDRICHKLKIQNSDQVLEIGTGWGGFALQTATNYGCHLTTTTISAAQHEKAEERFRSAGCSDRIHLLQQDYRELTGQYDKIVSIEMVEAVGEKFLDGYFRQCGRLLKPGGSLLIQAIVMPEQRYESYRRGIDYIRQYIFPGGFLPSVAVIQESVGRTSNLCLESLEDISPHYARTLKAWRDRFFRNVNEVRQLGFDDRFLRMWEYYLCYCEAAFREQAVRVVQILWNKPKN